MSLLLKALKQAETAHAEKSATVGDGLEFESLASPEAARARDWMEPPGVLGSSGFSPASARPPRRFTLPQISLVPATALLAALVALGYGIYLYFALQPPAAIATTPVASPSITPPLVAVGPVAISPPPAGDFAPPPVTSAPPDRPAADVAAPSPALTYAPIKPNRAPRARLTYPDLRERAKRAPTQAAPAFSFQPDSGSTLLNSAYDAYQKGQLNDAQRLYTQAAARERSVDALLGLAVIAGARNRDDDAARLYREVLDRDPHNAAAQAALLDLLGNTDRQATESRLKILIEREPSANLYQTLGNLYAEQNRWGETQAAYFEAYRAAPGNADYAFNLAVSLDRLHQPEAALPYYEKALSLGGSPRFERAQAESRIRQIKSLR